MLTITCRVECRHYSQLWRQQVRFNNYFDQQQIVCFFNKHMSGANNFVLCGMQTLFTVLAPTRESYSPSSRYRIWLFVFSTKTCWPLGWKANIIHSYGALINCVAFNHLVTTLTNSTYFLCWRSVFMIKLVQKEA